MNRFPTFTALAARLKQAAQAAVTAARGAEGRISGKRVAIGVGILLFVWFVWPTPYRYYKSGSVNYRVNRFTGGTAVLRGSGWK